MYQIYNYVYICIFKKIQDYVNEVHYNEGYYNVQYKQTEVNVTEGSGTRHIITRVLKGQICLFGLVRKGNQVGAAIQTSEGRGERVRHGLGIAAWDSVVEVNSARIGRGKSL